MTLQVLARRAPFIIAAVVGAGAILGCALVGGVALYLTKPPRAHEDPRACGDQAGGFVR